MPVPVITYRHNGYDGANNPITAFYADGVHICNLRTPGIGFTTSWQENELSVVHEKAKELYPAGFKLPYLVDGGGYVYRRPE